MSDWIEVKPGQITRDGDEIHVQFEDDEFGSRYVFFKVADILPLLTNLTEGK